MAVKMTRRVSAQVTSRKTVPSEQSSHFTNFRFNFGNEGSNVQPGIPHEGSGPNAAKCPPHHPGLTPRQRG